LRGMLYLASARTAEATRRLTPGAGSGPEKRTRGGHARRFSLDSRRMGISRRYVVHDTNKPSLVLNMGNLATRSWSLPILGSLIWPWGQLLRQENIDKTIKSVHGLTSH